MRLTCWALSAVLVLAASRSNAQVLNDPALAVEVVVTGLDYPTTMAFIGNDDFLILQKPDGRVRRVTGGVLQPGEVLDVPVDNAFDKGLLGIALDPDFVNDRHVFLYYSEAPADGQTAIANRVYRYTWDGAQLVDPHLILSLPNSTALRIGGVLAFGHDDELYTMMGDLQRMGKLQNFPNGPDPDDTGVILRTRVDGSPVQDNPFIDATGPLAPMNRYYGYGVRNSFGMAFDPVTGALWDTENGQSIYDEINRVDPGYNSGWRQIQGPEARSPQHEDALWVAPGSHYTDPKFSWYVPVAPTAIMFIQNPRLGCARVHDVLVGDTNCGNLHHFVPNAARNGFTFSSPELQDLVADNTPDNICDGEQSEFRFGSGFGVVTDMKTGPDGNVYVVELLTGTVYRIVPALSPADDADGDGVANACDCAPADATIWSTTVEVPRLRLSGEVATSLGWDAQRAATGSGVTYDVVTGSISSLHAGGPAAAPCTLGAALTEPKLDDPRALPAPGDGYFYLVRAGNGCGAGTFGDASIQPDPRDLLDATLPPACTTLTTRAATGPTKLR
jgi:glucose/arabinose dehydrogenase